MPIFLAILFFVTAALYASVGFGGGSTYNALLILHGVDYRILPAIALICNIIVVTGGVWRFANAGHINLKRLTPFVAASIPLAWAGGRIPISEFIFVGALGALLAMAGAQLLLSESKIAARPARMIAWPFSALIGGGLGFASGLVGIGGGIFLAPILYMIRWDSARAIAGACSFFILVNSLSGLLGQLMKIGDLEITNQLISYWTLAPAVLIGGQLGSVLSTKRISQNMLKRLTGILILYVAARLLLRFYSLATD